MGTLTNSEWPGALTPDGTDHWIHARELFHAAGESFDLAIPELDLPRGRLTALIGANGSGKSTLLGLVTGTRKLHGGRLSLDGTTGTGLRDRNRIGVQLQDAGFNPHYRVRQIRELHRAAYPVSEDAEFERFGVPEIGNRRYAQLSSGQHQRLHLALALAHRPQLALFDEPTSNLDPQYEARFIAALHEARTRDAGFSALFVTHAAAVVEACDDVLMLANGRVEVLDDKNVLVERSFGRLGARFEGEVDALDPIEAALREVPQVRRMVRVDGRLTVYGGAELRATVQALAAAADLARFAVWRTGAADILESLNHE